jgi:Trypsin-like peptidase domain
MAVNRCERTGVRTEHGMIIAAACSSVLLACSNELSAESVADQHAPLLYGSDDRLDFFELSDSLLKERVVRSTLAMIDRELVQVTPDGAVELASDTYADLYNLCPDERFAEQPSPAQCSAVLLDRSHVLTAAHCIKYKPCLEWRLVFGFYYEAATRLHSIRADDVFSCARVVASRYDRSGSAVEMDWAVIALDRSTDDSYSPVPIFGLDEPMRDGDPIALIGHGAGLPAKVDLGGRVANARAESLDYFTATTDSFHGSSGSGVYDGQGRLRGVLSRGGEDYEAATDAPCQRVHRVADEPVNATEKISYVARAVQELCASEVRPDHVCGPQGGCGVVGGRERAPCIGLWPFGFAMGLLARRRAARPNSSGPSTKAACASNAPGSAG